MSECKKFFGLFCKFEPRYSFNSDSLVPESITNRIEWAYFDSDSIEQILHSMQNKTYIYDVCTSCGKVVNQNENKNQSTS